MTNMVKAIWIADRMNYETNADDVFDVLLGNITTPDSFVADVNILSDEYDEDRRKHG